MSKCRYDLSEDCNNTDCLNCVLDKIRAEIEKETDRDNHADDYCDGYYDGMRNALAIIDKYKAEIKPKDGEK